MHIGQKHLAQIAKGFYGVNYGRPLAEWLNKKHTGRAERVAKAIVAAAQCARFADTVGVNWDGNPGTVKRDQHAPVIVAPAWNQFHKDMKGPFTIRVRLAVESRAAMPSWTAGHNPFISLIGRDAVSNALIFASKLQDIGLLGWIRQCRRTKCRKWFFAQRANQSFHLPECQKVYWQESDAGRQYHRDKMRGYRELNGLKAHRKARKR